MRATINKQHVDKAMDAYVHWRELSRVVQQAYDRWTRAPRSQAAAAFDEYTIALDREESASLAYAVLAGAVIR